MEEARSVWRTAHPQLVDRAQLVGGSFFESVPAADVYFMKHILHDWNDEDSVKVSAWQRHITELSTGCERSRPAKKQSPCRPPAADSQGAAAGGAPRLPPPALRVCDAG